MTLLVAVTSQLTEGDESWPNVFALSTRSDNRISRYRMRAWSRHSSELNVDNWNDNCEAKSEAKRPRPLRGLQVDSSLTRNVSYAVCR